MHGFFAVLLALILPLNPAFSLNMAPLHSLKQNFDGQSGSKAAPYQIVRPSTWNWQAFLGTAGAMSAAPYVFKVSPSPAAAAGLSLMAGAGAPWWLTGAVGLLHFGSKAFPAKNWLGLSAWRSPTVALIGVSAFLAMEGLASDPNHSRLFHPISRKPHLRAAFIGDSLSKNFHVSSAKGIALQNRVNNQSDWVLDLHADNGLLSLFELLGDWADVEMAHYARVGACVDSANIADGSLGYQVCKVKCFSSQVDELLSQKEFPDLILLWIGNNNTDWVAGASPAERKNPTSRLEHIPSSVEAAYRIQLGRLTEAAAKRNKKTAIVVFGLVNFEKFFEARDSAETYKKENPQAYPHLEDNYLYFESMKPEYRMHMAPLARKINQRLENMVLNTRMPGHVRIFYSDALSSADLGDRALLHSQDAWHASQNGHNRMAEIVFENLLKNGVLKYLEVTQPGK